MEVEGGEQSIAEQYTRTYNTATGSRIKIIIIIIHSATDTQPTTDVASVRDAQVTTRVQFKVSPWR